MKGWCKKSKDESGKRDYEVGGKQYHQIVGGEPVGDHSTTEQSLQEIIQFSGGQLVFHLIQNFKDKSMYNKN